MARCGYSISNFNSNRSGLNRRRAITSGSKALRSVFLNLGSSKGPSALEFNYKGLFAGTIASSEKVNALFDAEHTLQDEGR
jgi:hypothetical protein